MVSLAKHAVTKKQMQIEKDFTIAVKIVQWLSFNTELQRNYFDRSL